MQAQATLFPRVLPLQIFLYLQVLDFLTTMVGLRLGLQEASPFVRWLMLTSPAAGVALSKAVAIALAGVCLWRGKQRVIGWINYWYAGLVAWNLALILLTVKV